MKNVQLRELLDSDITDIALYGNNINVSRNLRDSFPYPYTKADAEWFINFTRGFSPRQNFAITLDEKFVGIMGIHPFDDIYSDTAEIGYWLGENYWGMGITSQAIPLIVQYGWATLKLQRIQAGVFDYNPASMRVLEKSGFAKEGILRKRLKKKGKYYDEHMYGILRP